MTNVLGSAGGGEVNDPKTDAIVLFTIYVLFSLNYFSLVFLALALSPPGCYFLYMT